MEHLRPARVDDLDDLVGLRVLMFTAMGTAPDLLAAPEWLAASRAWFRAALKRDDARIVVIESDGAVVAGGLAEVLRAIPAPSMPRGRLGFVSNVATHPHARGRGHARTVMTELVRWLDHEGDPDRIDLAATGEGAPLYRQLGFAEADCPTMRRVAPARGS